MKKILLLIMLLSVMLLAAEPICAFETGSKGLGGTISYASYKVSKDDPSTQGLDISPAFSYFVVRNLCLDISPGLNISWYKDPDSTYIDFDIKLGARYFYKKFYGGFYYEYSRYGQKGEEKHSVKYFTLTFGRLLGIAGNLYLDLGIDYKFGVGQWYRCGYDGCRYRDNESRQFQTRVGIAVFFK